MFFFVGGITPKLKKLNDQPLICPRCGLASLYQVEIDHYLNLFFIPVAPVKKGQPFYRCENCGWESPETSESFKPNASDQSPAPQNSTGSQVCPSCGRLADKEFYYCPYCGHSLK